jgi:hypothetical protein
VSSEEEWLGRGLGKACARTVERAARSNRVEVKLGACGGINGSEAG